MYLDQLKIDKENMLKYFRERASESVLELRTKYGDKDYKERASGINKAINRSRENLENLLEETCKDEKWINKNRIEALLLINYCSYIVMLEFRNMFWEYDYMTFSRRIGELWEPFCKLVFNSPVNTEIKYIPPTFEKIKQKLTDEIENYIQKLNISAIEKNELIKYYKKVWDLVTSGEIKMELDLHLKDKENKLNIDFKSGFNSNEKGNTNRLLLVGTIYKNLEENHKCTIFVRGAEDTNNHYLQTLKNSGIWDVFCGEDTYEEIYKLSGFNLKDWISKNINWKEDISKEFYQHLQANDLIKYLSW